MISGEFRLQSPEGEIVLPNQFTTYGMQSVVRAAFWREPKEWWIGLCAHLPADTIPINYLNEPPQGVGGYERVYMPLNKQHWGILGNVNGETYIESKVATFVPDTNAVWEPEINRLFITDGTHVVAVSNALPGGLQSVASVIAAPYRLYFR